MCGVVCSCCHKFLPTTEFDKRDDRPGLMAFCKTCCKEQCRETDYPPKEERGDGRKVYNEELD